MSKHTSQTRLKSVIKLILNEIRNQSHRPSDFFKTHSAQVEPLLVKSMVSVLTPDYSETKFCLGKKKVPLLLRNRQQPRATSRDRRANFWYLSAGDTTGLLHTWGTCSLAAEHDFQQPGFKTKPSQWVHEPLRDRHRETPEQVQQGLCTTAGTEQEAPGVYLEAWLSWCFLPHYVNQVFSSYVALWIWQKEPP